MKKEVLDILYKTDKILANILYKLRNVVKVILLAGGILLCPPFIGDLLFDSCSNQHRGPLDEAACGAGIILFLCIGGVF